LADVRLIEIDLGQVVVSDGIRYTPPALTLAMKVCAHAKRKFAPKGATDLADARRLLIAFPELRSETGPVGEALERVGDSAAREVWRSLLREPVVSDEEVDEGY
jgi:hypothetical protein